MDHFIQSDCRVTATRKTAWSTVKGSCPYFFAKGLIFLQSLRKQGFKSGTGGRRNQNHEGVGKECLFLLNKKSLKFANGRQPLYCHILFSPLC